MRYCSIVEKIALLSGSIFLVFSILEGLFRYIFVQSGLELLVYIPKTLLFFSVGLLLLDNVINLQNKKATIFLIFLFLTSLYISFFSIKSIKQILFGLWTFIPFLYGFLFFPIILDRLKKFKTFIFILWLISVIGIIINIFYMWPWSGFTYSIGDISIEANRRWYTGGLIRLSGFSKLSTVAATHIFVLGLVFYFLENRKHVLKYVVWLLTGISILLTTTKTILGIWLLFSLIFLLQRITGNNIVKFFIIIMVALSILFPISTFFVYYNLNLKDLILFVLLASFEERLIFTWPYTFNLINQYGLGILGRGIGGIGISQKYFENYLYSPGDNLFLYIFATFGILGVLVFILVSINIILNVNGNSLKEKLILYLYLYIVTQGVTLCVLEEPISAIIFGGLIYIALFNNLHKEQNLLTA